MATTTTRLGLRKPDPDPVTGDFVDAQADLNDNWDNIDGRIGLAVCTSATRPASPYAGQQIYETDTDAALFWDGVSWQRFYVNGQDAGWAETFYSFVATSGNEILRAKVSGESFDRFVINAAGLHGWGPGSATYDTFMQRTGVGLLAITDSLSVTNDLTVGDDVNVTGDASISGTLTVTGTATLNGRFITPQRKSKLANQIVNNSTTLVNDNHLVVPLEANALYALRGWIMFTSGTTPDFKCTFTIPASANWRAGFSTWNRTLTTGAQLVDNRIHFNGENAAIPGLGTTFSTQAQLIEIHGSIETAGTAGNLTFQFAQNTANASDTTVFKGSWLEAIRMD